MRNSEFGMRNEPDLKRRTKAFALELLEESELVSAAKLAAVKQEANDLIAITIASIKTARRNRSSNSALRTPNSAFE